MKIDKEVPFYTSPDNTHCFQASLKMIVQYFWPDKDYSWEELDKITVKVEGLWTWPMAGLIWLQKQGVEVRIIELFNYKRFAQFGGEYLIDEYGEEVGELQIKNSDIEQEKAIAKEFVEKVTVQKSIPTINDLKDFLTQDYLIICNVNSRKLNNKEGYSGHFIVLKGFDDKHFIIHDSGPTPAFENRIVDFDLFKKAWAYPNEKAKGIMAFRLKKEQNRF